MLVSLPFKIYSYRASLKLGLDKAVLQSMNTQQQASGVSHTITYYYYYYFYFYYYYCN